MTTENTLSSASAAARLPAQDLDRARAFYRDVLGLEPVEERPGGLLYRPRGGGEFGLFTSTGAPSGTHTQMGFEVDDLDAVVDALQARGLVIDDPGVVDIAGNYPSKGTDDRACWFRDSEGNVLGLGSAVGAPPSPVAIVEAQYRAYEREDRAAVEAALADDFRFRSPADTGFDKAGFLANCFPNPTLAGAFTFLRLADLGGGEVLVTYEYPKPGGTRSRNTEIVTVRDGRIAAVEVYFGWED